MQKLKTRVVKRNLNPEWNENLTLCVTDPSLPIKLVSARISRLRFYPFPIPNLFVHILRKKVATFLCGM